MARERLAQHLFRSRKSQSQRCTRRRPQTSRPRRNDHGGNGSALHPQQSRRQHHHSRYAETPQRRSQSRRQRQRPPASAVSTATFWVSTVFVASAIACIFSSTYLASL